MKIYLFLLSHCFLLINANKIYNCESLCFDLEICIKQCKIHGLQNLEQISEPKKHSIDYSSNNRRVDEDEDSLLQSSSPQSDTCGLRKANAVPNVRKGFNMGRIVGGEEAMPHEFPWQITMQIFLPKKGKVEHFCGGSILNDHWILSASHCLDILKGKESKIMVRMGSNKVLDESVPIYTVDKVIIHEGWDRTTQRDDIALMRLKEEIKFKVNEKNQYEVNTICLPEKDTEPEGSATLSGWGQTGANLPQAEFLQKITIPIYDRQKCAVNYQKYVQITDTKLCAGGKGGEDSCMGDSGGPLIQLKDGRAVQIGVVSFGYPCAIKDMPGVYTKVSKYIDWINKNMQ